MTHNRDPELPAGFQDADLEQAALEEAGDRAAALRRRGICDHLGRRLDRGHAYDAARIADIRARGTFPDRPTAAGEIPEGADLCLDCGQHVPTWRRES